MRETGASGGPFPTKTDGSDTWLVQAGSIRAGPLQVGPDRRHTRVREALLTVADGSFGTRAVSEDELEDGRSDVVWAAGVYGPGPLEALVAMPDWTRLGEGRGESRRWVLNLADGTVLHDTDAPSSIVRFAAVS